MPEFTPICGGPVLPARLPKNPARLFFLAVFTLLFAAADAQTGCPGCLVALPAGLPVDTIYLQRIPDGEQNKPYDEDVSFRMPKSTTPVAAADTSLQIPPGLPISKIEIIGVDNLPPGINWQPNQTVFQTASQTDGCIRLCGKPLVADTFVLSVKLRATVLFLTQETSFPMRFVVHPQTSTTAGFTLENIEGCGELTPEITNNIPSGGQPGFTYAWDFGDGATSTSENPAPHTYTAPGTYPIHYQAIIDTVGFVLESFTVLNVGCVDQLGTGAPDLYAHIKNASGQNVYNSGNDVSNASLPYTFPVGLLLGPTANYTLEVWDEDSGLKGSDDLCGTISFNLLSNDTLVSGAFRVVLNISHPVDTVRSVDSVVVYPVPQSPVILAPSGLEACAGENVVLGSNYGTGNQWFMNGAAIPGAVDFAIMPAQSGYYQVRYSNQFGCSAMSDSAKVVFHPLPAKPSISPNGAQACEGEILPLMSSYAAGNQWFMNGAALPGQAGAILEIHQNGHYQVRVSDANGCTATSDSVKVFFNALPAAPIFVNDRNRLIVADSTALPAGYLLQWFAFDAPIPGENGLTYCATASGQYGLEVRDPATGCKNYFEADIVHDPAFDCTVGTAKIEVAQVAISPNPAIGAALISWPIPAANARLRVFDLTGKLFREQAIPSGATTLRLDCSDFPAGIFTIEIADGARRMIGKLAVGR